MRHYRAKKIRGQRTRLCPRLLTGGDEALHLIQLIRCHLRRRQGLQDRVLKVSIKHGMSLGNLGHDLGRQSAAPQDSSSRCSGSVDSRFIRRLGRRLQCRRLLHFRLNQLVRDIAAPTGCWHCKGSEWSRSCSGVSGVPSSNMMPRYRSAPPFALIWSYLYFWMTVA